jgi:putative membrane protein
VYPRFRLTPLVSTLIAIHAVILMVGGRYTYAQVPFGFWMPEAFGLARNHYDRIGHFAQGFVPAMVAREILVRKSPLTRSR